MSRVSGALVVALALCACAPIDSAPSTRTRRSAVFGGSPAPTENQVFLLDLRYDNSVASICSATLISPRVLLTAAHCADPDFESGATSMTIRATNEPDDTMLMMSDMIPVTTVRLHPSWNAGNPNSDFDIALLLLATAPVGVTPAPRPAGTVSLSGQTVKLVGYGRSSTDPATSGTRRSVMSAVTSVQSATFHFGSGSAGTCVGDSGGPAFLGSEVVGVHSRGNSTCGTDDVDIRVDAYKTFIDTFIAANDPASCSADGRCGSGCTMPDPDCPCASDGTCNMAACGAGGIDDADCRCVANGACGAMCGTMDPDCCGADGSCDLACGAGGASDPDCRCVANGMCGATCGATDPDCCGADGTCDAACGMSDVDCRCRADATCDMTCGANGANDPDCPCGANSTCNMTCGASDPDCRCLSDGRCDASCMPTDPDCSNCGANGACNASCGISDPDCLDDGQICVAASECWGGQCLDDTRGFKFCSRTCAVDTDCLNSTTCQGGVCRAQRDPLTGAMGGCSAAPGALGVMVLAWLLRRRAGRQRGCSSLHQLRVE